MPTNSSVGLLAERVDKMLEHRVQLRTMAQLEFFKEGSSETEIGHGFKLWEDHGFADRFVEQFAIYYLQGLRDESDLVERITSDLKNPDWTLGA